MDQGGLKLEPEVVEVLKHIAEGKNFLLSGGAGSGKTYSLIQVIGELLRTDPSTFIACITYTNAAVHEIESRITSERLFVSTIHDFLWSAINPFQAELRKVLIELMSGDNPRIDPGSSAISNEMFVGKTIQYKEYRILGEGIISHDEVPIVACGMFEKYPKLRDILRDRFQYILVDEYQDTAPDVVKILLDYLPQSSRRGVCGFFGDAMQSIYDEGIGTIQNYVADGSVSEVRKEQNRRNPRLVYELANQLRSDDLVQHASEDQNAPNMDQGSVKDGLIRFFYSFGDTNKLDQVREHLGWDFDDVLETKELNLTHNLIAPQAGFEDLMKIYDKDGVLQFRDRIVKFIKKNDNLENYDGLTFTEAVASVQKGKIGKELTAVSPTNKMKEFMDDHPYLLDEANKYNFYFFRKMWVNKDQLVDDKKQSEEEAVRKGSQRCAFIKHVFKIQTVVHLYKQQRYNEFLRRTEFRFSHTKDKVRLKKCIEAIGAMENRPIIDVIDFAHEHRLCIKDDHFRDFHERKKYLFNRLISVKYASYQKLYEYLEGRTTYSTQHKIKGQEFNRVLVVLDAGGWNNYNFNYLFEGCGTETVRLRTQKLFYVCCTRAKDMLAVYFRNPTAPTLTQATNWFGADNVVEV